MKRLLAAIALIALFVTPAFAGDNGGGERTVTVMTRNVYDGIDPEVDKLLGDISSGQSQYVILLDAGEVMAAAKERDFHARAALIAKEVASVHPDLIGVQEVELFRSQCPADFVLNNADQVEIDFLEILRDALEQERMHYDVVVVSSTIDIEMPGITPQGLCDLRLTDRDVILARADEVDVSNVRSARYRTPCLRTIPWIREWVSADVKTRGRTFRFFTTHLETEACTGEQLMQALELIEETEKTDLPVVITGDFNSDANGGPMATPAYPAMIAAGFRDAWAEVHPDDPAYTCCQDPTLLDPNPFASQQKRIDLIFTRGNFGVLSAVRLGATSGVWASDHAGVAATLSIRP